jgi:hypothetical protein
MSSTSSELHVILDSVNKLYFISTENHPNMNLLNKEEHTSENPKKVQELIRGCIILVQSTSQFYVDTFWSLLI